MSANKLHECGVAFSHFINQLDVKTSAGSSKAPLLVVINNWYQTPVPFFSALIGLGALQQSGCPLVFVINDCPYPGSAAAAPIAVIKEHCAGLARFGRLVYLSEHADTETGDSIVDIKAEAVAMDRRHRYGFGIIPADHLPVFDGEASDHAGPALRGFAALLASEKPACVLIPGGVANTMHGFMALARRQGVRTATYDAGAGTPRVYFSGHDVAAQGWEVPGLVRQILDRADPRELEYCRGLAYRHADLVATGADDMLRFPFETPAAVMNNDLLFLTSMEQDSSLLGVPGIFPTQEEWLRETIMAVRRTHPQARITVRQHPDERRFRSPYGERAVAIAQALAANDPLLTVYDTRDNIQTRALIAASSLVLSAGSTAGLEAGMLGRPVLSHAMVPYVGLGFCERPTDREDFFARIRCHLDAPARLPAAAVLEAALFYYAKNYCWRVEIPVTPDPPIFLDWISTATTLPFAVEGFRHVVEAIATGANLCQLRHGANLRSAGIA